MIVSVDWLRNQKSTRIKILDATLKPKQKDVIPGALFFDLEGTFSDQLSPLPHTMPSAEAFQEEVRRLSIDQDSIVVIYDEQGVYSSPRVWWMFKSMGHQEVVVLDGGLPEWKLVGYELQAGHSLASGLGNFQARDSKLFCDAASVGRALGDSAVAVVDARSEARFVGAEVEPRPGLRGGHMPNALNLPFVKVLNGTKVKETQELKKIFSSVFRQQEQLIFSCGSGVTACILALGAELAGYSEIKVYDGSWSEWGADLERPVVTRD